MAQRNAARQSARHQAAKKQDGSGAVMGKK
jgi:hypothetical protein